MKPSTARSAIQLFRQDAEVGPDGAPLPSLSRSVSSSSWPWPRCGSSHCGRTAPARAARVHSSAPAVTTVTKTPAASGGSTGQAGAASKVYHGSAPGVQGLSSAIAKAHGAVATSEQNAAQLEAHSAQASSATNAPAAAAPATSGAAATSVTVVKSTTTSARHGAPTTSTTVAAVAGKTQPIKAHSGAGRVPARQALVERALKEGKLAVILIWNPKGADDVAVRNELLMLEAVHHLVKSVPHSAQLRKALAASGLELQKKFAAFIALQSQVSSFGSVTRGVQVYGTPTLLVRQQERPDDGHHRPDDRLRDRTGDRRSSPRLALHSLGEPERRAAGQPSRTPPWARSHPAGRIHRRRRRSRLRRSDPHLARDRHAQSRRAHQRRRLRRERLRRAIAAGSAVVSLRARARAARRRAHRRRARSPPSSAASAPASATPPSSPPTRCTARSAPPRAAARRWRRAADARSSR